MTDLSDEEIIDQILRLCVDSGKPVSVTGFFEQQLGIKKHWKQSSRIIEFIEYKGLADITQNDIAMANPTTNSIQNFGGYLAFIDSQNKKQEHADKIKKASDDKILIDLTISKWQKKTFWYVFIAGIAGLCLSIYSTIQSNLTQLQLEKTETRIDSLQKTVIRLDRELLKAVSDTSIQVRKNN